MPPLRPRLAHEALDSGASRTLKNQATAAPLKNRGWRAGEERGSSAGIALTQSVSQSSVLTSPAQINPLALSANLSYRKSSTVSPY